MINVPVTKNDGGQRLDRFMRKYLRNASLSMIYRMIRKDVKVNGKRAHIETELKEGDVLSIYISQEELSALTGGRKKTAHVKKQFHIVFEDDNILVADKPFGLLTHGDSREKRRTLVNQVKGYLESSGTYDEEKEKVFRIASANRLDRNTTGLVVFGKTSAAMKALSSAFSDKDRIEKYYLTIVSGELEKELRLSGRLEKDEKRNMTRVLSDEQERGKSAETIVKPLACSNGYAFVMVRLMTGRTHQIRAHLAQAGYPLIGDAKYGDKKTNGIIKKKLGITTQLLHACRLVFREMEEPLGCLEGRSFEAGLPQMMEKALEKLLGISRKEAEDMFHGAACGERDDLIKKTERN